MNMTTTSGDLLDDLKWRGLISQTTDEKELREALKKPITLYLGTDPTAPSIHVGNLVVLLVRSLYTLCAPLRKVPTIVPGTCLMLRAHYLSRIHG